ncbi:MAG: hypothetical protein J6Y58_04925 [Clostridiales bacterium]|nr:hypothetical protein [Clostridiales bacterium]
MNAIYAKVLEMSLYGSIAILIVLLFRLVFRKLPKRVLIVFWMIVAVRLLLPLNFASPTSILNVSRLFRSGGEKTEVTEVDKMVDEEGDASGAGAFAGEMDIDAADGGADKADAANAGKAGADAAVTSDASGEGAANKAETVKAEEEPARLNSKQAQAFRVIAYVWLLVIVGLIVLFGVRYVIFYSKARWSSRSYDGRYFTTDIKSPFVIGFVNPKIFIPKHFDDDEREYILNHEWTHIKNKDGIIKLISYAVLCIHWFNPLVWLAFVMLCADIEMRVDEETTDSFDMDMVKEYCMSLVKHAAADSGGTFLESTAFSGLGFGGMETKLRIKNLLTSRKVSKFMPVLAIIITFSVVFFASSRSFGSPAEDYFAKLGRSPAEAEVTEVTEESTADTADSTENTEETTPSETPSETEEPSESTAPLSDYAQAYIKLIEDLQTDSREAKLTLIHVDGDDIPELLMTEPKADQTDVYCLYLYTFRNGREELVLSYFAGDGAYVNFFCYQPYQDAICQYRRPQNDDPATPYLVERNTMDNYIRGANGIDIDYTKDTPNWLMMGYEDGDTVIGYLKSGNIPMDNKYEKHPQYAPFTPTPTPQPTEAPTPTPTEEPTTTTEPPEQTPTRYQPQREPIADYSLYNGNYVVNGGCEILYLFYVRDNLIEVNLWVNRTANLEQAIVEFEDNIGIFYYKGVKDENWNGVIDDGEEFYRKATIELLPDGVKITIEDVNSNEFELSKDVSSVFAGGEYIRAGTLFYPFSSRSS